MPEEQRPVLLYAEDDPEIAYIFGRNFEQVCPAWKLVWASNGLVAVNYMMESRMPDAVITDLQMPVMSGYELISWIRTQDDCSIPIIVMSHVCDLPQQQKCLQLGADDFVPKMQSAEKLQELLSRICPARGAASHLFRRAAA